MKKVNVFLTIVLLLSVVYLLVQHNRMDRQLALLDKPVIEKEVAEEEGSEVELVKSMTFMHIYMNKLYFSGMAMNHELIEFYTHEIEEIMEEIEAAKVEEDGYDISALMKSYGLAQLEQLESKLEKAEDFAGFEEAYKQFIQNSCNSCHRATEHEYIQITVPETRILSNQNFKK